MSCKAPREFFTWFGTLEFHTLKKRKERISERKICTQISKLKAINSIFEIIISYAYGDSYEMLTLFFLIYKCVELWKGINSECDFMSNKLVLNWSFFDLFPFSSEYFPEHFSR